MSHPSVCKLSIAVLGVKMDTGADCCWRREEHSGEVSQSRRFVCDSVSFCNEIPELNDNSRALQLKIGTEIVHTSNAISEAASRPAQRRNHNQG